MKTFSSSGYVETAYRKIAHVEGVPVETVRDIAQRMFKQNALLDGTNFANELRRKVKAHRVSEQKKMGLE
jgi:hypothetical protein